MPTPPDETIQLPASEQFGEPAFPDYGASGGRWAASSSSSHPLFENDEPPGLESSYDHVYPAGAASPASISSNKADGGSDSGGEYSDTPEYKGRLKPASFSPSVQDWGQNTDDELPFATTGDPPNVIDPFLDINGQEGSPLR